MSFDVKLKEKIIHDMCCTFRHDYDLPLVLEMVNDGYLSGSSAWERVVSGIHPEQKQVIYNQMKQIFENCFEKYFHVEIG